MDKNYKNNGKRFFFQNFLWGVLTFERFIYSNCLQALIDVFSTREQNT